MTPTDLKNWRGPRTQRAAAELLGCAERSIRNWESGKTDIPHYIALAISAVQLGLPAYGSLDRSP